MNSRLTTASHGATQTIRFLLVFLQVILSCNRMLRSSTVADLGRVLKFSRSRSESSGLVVRAKLVKPVGQS